MSAATVINLGIAVFLLVCTLVLFRLCRTPRPRTQWRYEGPDSLRLMEDLDAHLDRHFAELSGLYERLGPPDLDPEVQAGLARLHDAVRPEQQDGGTS
ncbi:hypothetical protein ACFYPC_08980 [Streptomyces sp. NPDC005808]|uniref:hypothetical protein n=1 Tax=Streptomyces sp. NPDC005808 TaxID=3364734 RepID=UPI0036881A2B